MVFLLLILNIFTHFSSISMIDFEQANISWDSGSFFAGHKKFLLVIIYCLYS